MASAPHPTLPDHGPRGYTWIHLLVGNMLARIGYRARAVWEALRTGRTWEQGYLRGWSDHRFGRPREVQPPQQLALVVPLHIGRHRAAEDTASVAS